MDMKKRRALQVRLRGAGTPSRSASWRKTTPILFHSSLDMASWLKWSRASSSNT